MGIQSARGSGHGGHVALQCRRPHIHRARRGCRCHCGTRHNISRDQCVHRHRRAHRSRCRRKSVDNARTEGLPGCPACARQLARADTHKRRYLPDILRYIHRRHSHGIRSVGQHASLRPRFHRLSLSRHAGHECHVQPQQCHASLGLSAAGHDNDVYRCRVQCNPGSHLHISPENGHKRSSDSHRQIDDHRHGV